MMDHLENLRVSFEFDGCVFEQPPQIEGEPFAVSGKFTAQVYSALGGSFTVALEQYPPPAFPQPSQRSASRSASRLMAWN